MLETKQPATVEDRFWKYAEPEPMSGCWLWIGYVAQGAPKFASPGRSGGLARTWAYEHFIGPIPGGRLASKCGVKICVNPSHAKPGKRGRSVGVSTEGRFEALYEAEPNSGCWLWIGTDSNLRGTATTAYGLFYSDKKMVLAHRWAYEHYVGPIPAGLQLDHKCRTRCCVNPKHLEPVTGSENCRRSPVFMETIRALGRSHLGKSRTRK